MDATEKINSAWPRSVRGLTRRPQLGKVTRRVTARLIDGLTYERLLRRLSRRKLDVSIIDLRTV